MSSGKPVLQRRFQAPLFDRYAKDSNTPVLAVGPLSDLAARPDPETTITIGIDADYWLENYGIEHREPLLLALGGDPLGLEELISRELRDVKSIAKCELFFFFHGLSYGDRSSRLEQSAAVAQLVSEGYKSYDKNHESDASRKWGQAASVPQWQALTEWLKRMLTRNGYEFVVAPYSAHAQMVCAFEEGQIQAMMGPSTMLLYGAQSVITKMHCVYKLVQNEDGKTNGTTDSTPTTTVNKVDEERSWISWIDFAVLQEKNPTSAPQTLLDAIYLTGSSELAMCPALPVPTYFPNGANYYDVVLALNTNGNVYNLCQAHREHCLTDTRDYWKEYMAARGAIEHMPILTKYNTVAPRSERYPDDIHELLSGRLAEELMYYMYIGMIQPRLLDWLVRGVQIPTPVTAGDDSEIRTLVQGPLASWRERTLSLIAYSCHRYYQNAPVTTTYWFDPENPTKFEMRGRDPPKADLLSWRMKGPELKVKAATSKDSNPGTLKFALLSLKDTDFAAKTKKKRSKDADDVLTTKAEILSNVLWRFLFLREYVTKDHQLTPWGKVLASALENINSNSPGQADAVLLAIELIRLKVLVPTGYDAAISSFVVRFASVGKAVHNAKGYTGPLDSEIPRTHALVDSVRTSLRDLLEATLAFTFLEGDVERHRADHLELSSELPFSTHPSAILPLVTKTFLEGSTPSSGTVNGTAVSRVEQMFANTDVPATLGRVFELVDAVAKGVESGDSGIVDESVKKGWSGVQRWLREKSAK